MHQQEFYRVGRLIKMLRSLVHGFKSPVNYVERKIPHQSQNDVIEISEWSYHEETPFYPVGARSKELKYSPPGYDGPYCLPNHRYLFKHSWDRYPDQYWAELVAYRIGRLMGLPIPPSFAAFDSVQGISGSLSEWFYGYGGNTERYVTGGDYMQGLVDDFDHEKGTKHNFNAIAVLCRLLVLSAEYTLSEDWIEYWGLCFLFDAVIGNTDRHQDNWGMLIRYVEGGDPRFRFRFAPYFDNGTSLGHEIDIKRQKRMLADPEHLARYIGRGTHHIRAQLSGERVQHAEFIEAFSLSSPELLEKMRSKLEFTDAEVENELRPLTEILINHPFTIERAKFVATLICSRRDNLIQKIDELRQ